MPEESSAGGKRRPSSLWLVTAGVFVVSFLLLLPFYLQQPTFHDADSYFHLAVARAYTEVGFFAELDWARFSLMAERFGDKEFLFHVLLMPFASLGEGAEGGRVALAFLNALIAAALAYLGMRAIGIWGALVPFFLFLTSTDWVWRLTRIRAELLSLLLLLVALALIAARRYRWLAVVGAIFALSYTAFHAFFGLCLLIFLFQGLVSAYLSLPGLGEKTVGSAAAPLCASGCRRGARGPPPLPGQSSRLGGAELFVLPPEGESRCGCRDLRRAGRRGPPLQPRVVARTGHARRRRSARRQPT
jgi:hypothetical protein